MSSNEPRLDVRRVIIVWLVLSVVAVLAIWFGLGPHMPPGSATAQAHEQREANLILSPVLAPIAVGLLVYFGFVLTTFRQRGEFVDGPPLTGDSRLQSYWIGASVTIVLCLAAYGTYALYATESSAAGSGGGQGPNL